jgi:hypothetical protein
MMSLLALLATRHEPWDTLGDLWHPIWLIWWTVIGVPIHAILGWLLSILIGNPIADAVGPFGIAIVLLTILIKLIIAPVFQYQLTTSRPSGAAADRPRAGQDPQAAQEGSAAPQPGNDGALQGAQHQPACADERLSTGPCSIPDLDRALLRNSGRP